MNLHRTLWWTLAASGAVVGALDAVATSSIMTALGIFAVLAICLGPLSATLWSLDDNAQRGWPITALTVLQHGCLAALAVVSFFGLTELIGVAVLPVSLLLVASCPVVVSKLRARSTPGHSAGR